MKMASMDDDYEAEFMKLVGEFMEQGFNQQEAIDAARDELERQRDKFMADGGRAQYGLGSLVKSVKKAVKGVVKGVGKVAKSPLGFLNLSGDKKGPGAAMDALKIAGLGGSITGLLSSMEQQEGESDIDYAQRRAQVNDQLKVQFSRLYPKGENETPEDYDVRISAMVESADDQTITPGQFAVGGRVGLASGANDRYEAKIKELMDKGLSRELAEALVLSELSPEAYTILDKKAEGGRVSRAFGSDKLVEQASGIEGLPINMNSKGVKELDMRETGGFIPPVGVKEKADDIPAMLSNNEFVFTADAVRAAGGGSVNKGAQRMYDLMKNLESKVV